MPGVSKENIEINAYDNSLELTTAGAEGRKYHEVLELPTETDIGTATSTYTNGILEITYSRKNNNVNQNEKK
jgi:HSP20 family protein